MSDRSFSAPGKLFVCGEYAVLWGGEARILAVGPRLGARLRLRDDRRVHLLGAEGRSSGDATPAGVHWAGGVPAERHFVAVAADLAFRASGAEGPGFALALEASPLHHGQKLGLGSSARATVLAAEAARQALAADWDTLKLSLLAHHVAQGGRGSGADVAACFAGGLSRYRAYDVAALHQASTRGELSGGLRRSAPVELTRLMEPRLPALYAFSGTSAVTVSRIARVEAAVSAEGRAAFVDRSDELGAEVEAALGRADLPALTRAFEALQALLNSVCGALEPGLDQIVRLAAAHGCAAKQSGAGGGDGALIFGADAGALQVLQEALVARGLQAFPVAPEGGLRGEGTAAAQLGQWMDAAP